MIKVLVENKAFAYNRGGLAVELPDYIIEKFDIKRGEKIYFMVDGDKIFITKSQRKEK